MNVLAFIIQLLCGAAAGSIVGSACPNTHLRLIGSSVIGMIGGAAAAQTLLHIGGGVENVTEMQVFWCSVAGGAAGGWVLTGLIGFITSLARRRR